MSDPQELTHYDETPGGKIQTPADRYNHFVQQLAERESEITSMLPSNVSPQKFRNAALSAVKRDPMILNASPRTLFVAITQAAQDGLLPDGKEGVILVFKGEAKWMAMAAGIRKRARELDHLLIDAQVVHKNDKFVWRQGDDPAIEHEPAQLGTPRGEMIGAYAVFKREDGDILHREVMDREQIMMVKGQSKNQDGLLWTKFETEGWRKTVARRGIKTVPSSEGLMQIVAREDENFTFDAPAPVAALKPPPAPPPAPKLESKPAVTLDASVKKEPMSVASATATDATVGRVTAEDVYADFVRDSYDELNGTETEQAVEELRDRVLEDLKVGDRGPWTEKCAERSAEIFGGG